MGYFSFNLLTLHNEITLKYFLRPFVILQYDFKFVLKHLSYFYYIYFSHHTTPYFMQTELSLTKKASNFTYLIYSIHLLIYHLFYYLFLLKFLNTLFPQGLLFSLDIFYIHFLLFQSLFYN